MAENILEKPEKKPLSSFGLTLIMSNCLLAILTLWSYSQFGSVSNALAYLSGDRLIVDALTKSFGKAKTGKELSVDFVIANMSNEPVTIIGAILSSSSVTPEQIPLILQPSERHRFKIRVLTNSKAGNFLEFVRLYTDYSEKPEIPLCVVGWVSQTGEGKHDL